MHKSGIDANICPISDVSFKSRAKVALYSTAADLASARVISISLFLFLLLFYWKQF